ncbi:OsmC family protein [Dyella psychrodurans]|uniref:OsmC family peroxiredoxin n=1 Tax=Dyella psychrodurans TaxID=1927960 RepID=A0A370X2R7_9GAMM|nr:OsmC family protein [Dyella psychrodurans]RDS82646.1 OsmC family peroxiredoxin [Dyella psychrodurans]
MSEEQLIEVSLEQTHDYEFRVRFDGTAVPDLVTDETSPLGGDAGPNPSRMLLVGVANCLSASLLFALRKFKNAPGKLSARARATTERNEQGRWRIVHIAVDLQLADAAVAFEHVDRALAQFEDFCIVTESVRQGIAVDVSVRDATGAVVHTSHA